MSKSITLIYPHQLFLNHPALSKERVVYLIEDPLYFSQYKFHKQKLVLHRASMKAYEEYLLKEGYDVMYVEHMVDNQFPKHAEVHVVDVVDNWLQKKIEKSSKVIWYESPQFLTSTSEVTTYWNTHKRHLHHDFYVWQRKRLNILIKDGKPVGGSWSFDTENRSRLSEDAVVPQVYIPAQNSFVKEAILYVKKHFKDNYGDIDSFWYATTHAEARTCLDNFLKHRLVEFGPYEDAISTDHPILFHSVLSPYLNIGLLTPKEVVDALLLYAETHANTVPLNSLEGCIRQIIGWREFMRMVYVCDGTRMRNKNVLRSTRNLAPSWWKGTTGIFPIDHAIKTLISHAYTHHIVRLMILGNIMTLLKAHPNEVYRWFMEWYIDAYDWVMVPNVYGMALFADGGTIVTKPYIASSMYLKKMSNYPKGKWEECYDSLFWEFVGTHKRMLSTMHRLLFMVKLFDSFSKEKQESLKERARHYTEMLTNR